MKDIVVYSPADVSNDIAKHTVLSFFTNEASVSALDTNYTWLENDYSPTPRGTVTVDVLAYDKKDVAPVLIYVLNATDAVSIVRYVGAVTTVYENMGALFADLVLSKKAGKVKRGFTGKPILHLVLLGNSYAIWRPDSLLTESFVGMIRRLDITVRTSVVYELKEEEGTAATRLLILPLLIPGCEYEGQQLPLFINETAQ